ncbi:bacterio-opsin activator domain-containing protein [Haloarchaeobius salinus]|uniref:bacterio-opsin activator domain-containing protein n=1 Tax=Haloarchaeobius salinus TaxID=1198298 RepID=UPI00210A846D|nr:bacterio-opsin activator domain-containing protein [Haloarchaeobius salinus]
MTDDTEPVSTGPTDAHVRAVAGVDTDDSVESEGASHRRPHPDETPGTARGINRLLVGLGRGVGDCGCRDDAERTLCRGLVDSGLYESVWVGVRSLDGGGLAARTSAGDGGESGRTDGLSAAVTPPDATHPAVSALRSGETAVADAGSITAEGWPVPEHAPDEGLVAAVPVGSADTVDSVFAVHTRRRNAFGELERTGLEALGTTLGLTVDAIRGRELFFADGVVELELRVTDDDSPLVRASAAHDCRISLEGYAAAEGDWRLYCDVAGTELGEFADCVTADPAVADSRSIVERSTGGRVEIEATTLPVLNRTVAVGATVRSAVADHGACRVTLELPRSADSREVVASLRVPFPDLDFLSCRELDRQAAEPTAATGVLDGLTDRQRETLETAYRAGYFEWPRRNSAEETAPELGIASSTFHLHLREAQRRVLDTLLD